jgi:hypothetical protein
VSQISVSLGRKIDGGRSTAKPLTMLCNENRLAYIARMANVAPGPAEALVNDGNATFWRPGGLSRSSGTTIPEPSTELEIRIINVIRKAFNPADFAPRCAP